MADDKLAAFKALPVPDQWLVNAQVQVMRAAIYQKGMTPAPEHDDNARAYLAAPERVKQLRDNQAERAKNAAQTYKL